MSVNDGLVTAAGSIHRPAASPLAKTVLPAPRSPLNRKTARALSCAPMRSATSNVASAECVMISLVIAGAFCVNGSCVTLIHRCRREAFGFAADADEGFAQ